MNNRIIKWVVVFLIFAISFTITFAIKNMTSEENTSFQQTPSTVTPQYVEQPTTSGDPKVTDTETITTVSPAETDVDTGMTVIPEKKEMVMLDIEIKKPKCDYNTLTYDLTVKVKNLPQKAVANFIIYDELTKATVVKCNNGQFKKIPSTESGKYRLSIHWKDSLGYEGLGIDTLITGFKPFEKPKVKKLEAQELQTLINNCDRQLSTKNKRISPNIVFRFTNIQANEKHPETIDEIYNKIKFGMWSSVSVSSVEYNDENQVVKITLNINHAEE